MASLTEADVKTLVEIVDRTAERIARRYSSITSEDVAQAIWLWAVEHADYVHDAMEDEHPGRVAKALYHAGIRYAEKEWKASLPYDWRDQYEYSRPEVARLLPLALNDDLIPGLSGGGLHDGPSHKADPALGGGLLASVIDVRMAYAKLSKKDRIFLADCVNLDLDWTRVGAIHGVQENSAYAKYMRILDRIVTRHLGRREE